MFKIELFKKEEKEIPEKDITEMDFNELQKVIVDINNLFLKNFFGEKRHAELSELNSKERRKRELEMIKDMSFSITVIHAGLGDPSIIYSKKDLMAKFDLTEYQYKYLRRKVSMDDVFRRINARNLAEEELEKRSLNMLNKIIKSCE